MVYIQLGGGLEPSKGKPCATYFVQSPSFIIPTDLSLHPILFNIKVLKVVIHIFHFPSYSRNLD